MTNGLTTYSRENGGRVLVLLLLFLLAIYEFITAGFNTFVIICLSPLLVLFVYAAFSYKMSTFWTLIVINYFIQMKDIPVPVPMSLYNELLETVTPGYGHHRCTPVTAL